MDNYNLMEVDNIIDYFDIDQMKSIIDDQIINSSDYSECGIVTDHFKPLYAKYKNVTVDPKKGITEDDVLECKKKFDVISLQFASAVCNKFGIDVDEFWLENATDDERFVLTLYLYTFFVVDLKTVLTDILINFITTNADQLAEMFDGDNDKAYQKGATFNALKDILTDIKYAVICANIFDVIYYVFDTLSCEQLFQYAPEDYLPINTLKEYLTNGTIGGNFNEKIMELVKNNAALRQSLAFSVITYVQSHYKAHQ